MPAMDNAHALVIGIANYRHVNRLPPTVLQDAQDVHDLLVDPQHCAYPPDNVQLLLDGAATQAAMRQALAHGGLGGRGPAATVRCPAGSRSAAGPPAGRGRPGRPGGRSAGAC